MNSAIMMLLIYSGHPETNVPPLESSFLISNDGSNLITNDGDDLVTN